MKEIIRLFGPWEIGKRFTLLIANNLPGGADTKESNLPAA